MLDLSDRTRTGISILTSAADHHVRGLFVSQNVSLMSRGDILRILLYALIQFIVLQKNTAIFFFFFFFFIIIIIIIII